MRANQRLMMCLSAYHVLKGMSLKALIWSKGGPKPYMKYKYSRNPRINMMPQTTTLNLLRFLVDFIVQGL
jgi:hypothetical protein